MLKRIRQSISIRKDNEAYSLNSRLRYWIPRWRFATIRVVERILVGGEIALHSPQFWSHSVPDYVGHLQVKRRFEQSLDPIVFSVKEETLEGRVSWKEELWTPTPKHTYLLNDVTVDPVSGVPWIPNGDVLAEVSQFGVDPRWSDIAYQWRRKSRKWPGTQTVLIAPNYPNYYHFLIEEMPRFLSSLEFLSHDANVLLPIGTTEWAKAILREFGIAWTEVPRRPIEVKNYAVTGRSLMLPAPRDWELLRRNCSWNEYTIDKNSVRVFIPRIGYTRQRPWERGVANRLRSRGWKVADPGTMTFRDQIELFSRASVVAGLSGAAFANIAWMQQGAQVVLLNAPFAHHGYIWNKLCKLSGVDFLACPVRQDASVAEISNFLGQF